MRKILVVDDDPLNLLVLCGVLEAEQDVCCVPESDPARAIRRFEEDRPDLVLLDYQTPVLSGLDVLNAMRSHASDRLVPIVMVTALDDADTKTSARKAGACGYVVKPIDPRGIRALVRGLLDRPGREVAPD